MTFNLNNIIRPNIKALTAYSSARDEFKGQAEVFLDANENPFPSDFNRYPGKDISTLQEKLAQLKGIDTKQLLLGNGSDESLDLIFRAFCEPYQHSILCFAPTYSMYKIWAQVNAVAVKEVPFLVDFEWTAKWALENIEPTTRMIFLCTPNNPTGTVVSIDEIEKLCQEFAGLVIVDEAYIDFSEQASALSLLKNYPNLVVIQTLSKAWGLAGVRIGLAMASLEIINVLNKIKPPYNISSANAKAALLRLENGKAYKKEVQLIKSQKAQLIKALNDIKQVVKIYKSDANFLLVRFKNSTQLFDYLKAENIIVRDRSRELNCENCLRLTVGTPEENTKLIEAIKTFEL
ncbi:MAG: histidinol-phosphate transaminase [Flavobacteriaceae bacterium]